MHRLIILFFLLVAPSHAFAFGAVACGQSFDGRWSCAVSFDDSTDETARKEAIATCEAQYPSCRWYSSFSKTCVAVAIISKQFVATKTAPIEQSARNLVCNGKADCEILNSSCDTTNNSYFEYLEPLRFGAISNGILFGLGIIIALLIYARRASLANLIIHGNLPYKLPVYGEDIQCLFKRTQRINWYGRVVFGIIVNLAMTHQQLIDVRKYWLGRVVAFDSLRRQRQNELSRMHLQLAAQTTVQAKDKTALSQLWALIKWLFLFLFYIFRAIFSFLFGFLFIRVNIASLVRGRIIESKNLVLILQAKQAIEETASYLKEYLNTANSFDGSDEIHDA